MPPNLHFEVHKARNLRPQVNKQKRCTCDKVCTSRFTKPSAFKSAHCAALPVRFATRHFQDKVEMSSAVFVRYFLHVDRPRIPSSLPRNQGTPKTSTFSKALRLPRNLHIEVNPPKEFLPLPRTLDFRPQKLKSTRPPLCLPRKIITKPESLHGTRLGPAGCEPAQSKCTSKISRGMNVP